MTLWPRMQISPGSPSGTGPSFSSKMHISTPQTGKPIEPGLRGRSSMLKLATGEVSDNP